MGEENAELKEKTRLLMREFNIETINNFCDRIGQIVFSEERGQYFDKYISLFPDLSIDWMQRIYQFYCADRREKKQDYTPVVLSKLVARLTEHENEKKVYDCCAGSGSLTIQKWWRNKELEFECEELDCNVLNILLFNLSIRNIRATVINRNVLTGEFYRAYSLTPSTKYSTIETLMFYNDMEADTSLSNPPFNLRKVQIKDDIIRELPERYSTNFAFVANCLIRCNTMCAMILPTGVLTSKAEEKCRERLIKSGWLAAAISLPGNIFESTPVSTCILLIDKRKTSQSVMIVDATKMKSVETREQRGEGDSSHYNRIYKKKFNTFTDGQIEAVVQCVKREVDDCSKMVTVEQLKEKGFSLNFGTYKGVEFIYTEHRDFNVIIREINAITKERNKLKLTINKTWAKQLGLEDVAELCEKGNEIVKGINKTLGMLNEYEVKEKLVENKYIRLSASKIMTIEHMEKDYLSSIMPFFFNMYKQHIYYLNEVENNLLVELRDSLLPFLMSGQLTIKEENEECI